MGCERLQYFRNVHAGDYAEELASELLCLDFEIVSTYKTWFTLGNNTTAELVFANNELEIGEPISVRFLETNSDIRNKYDLLERTEVNFRRIYQNHIFTPYSRLSERNYC